MCFLEYSVCKFTCGTKDKKNWLVCNFCLDASKIDDENETDQDEKNIGKYQAYTRTLSQLIKM